MRYLLFMLACILTVNLVFVSLGYGDEDVVLKFDFRIKLLKTLDYEWGMPFDLDGGGDGEVFFKIYFIGWSLIGYPIIIKEIDTRTLNKDEPLFVLKTGKDYQFIRFAKIIPTYTIQHYRWFAIRVDIFEKDLFADDFLGSIPADKNPLRNFNQDTPMLRLYDGSAITFEEKKIVFENEKIKITIFITRIR